MSRITNSMVEGTLETISSKTGLSFMFDGRNVYDTSQGSHSKYVYGATKTVVYDKLQAILAHIYAMERMKQIDQPMNEDAGIDEAFENRTFVEEEY